MTTNFNSEECSFDMMPTHKVSFFGLRCFFHEDTNAMYATLPFLNWLIPVLAHSYNFFFFITSCFVYIKNPGFPIKILEDYTEEDCDSEEVPFE